MIEKNISSIEIKKAGDNEYYFVFRLPSDAMFVSVFFDSPSEVMAAVEYSQRNSADHTLYVCETTTTGDSYFVFLTKGNKPIGQSTVFEQKTTMNIGLQYMQKHLQEASIVDIMT